MTKTYDELRDEAAKTYANIKNEGVAWIEDKMFSSFKAGADFGKDYEEKRANVQRLRTVLAELDHFDRFKGYPLGSEWNDLISKVREVLK